MFFSLGFVKVECFHFHVFVIGVDIIMKGYVSSLFSFLLHKLSYYFILIVVSQVNGPQLSNMNIILTHYATFK